MRSKNCIYYQILILTIIIIEEVGAGRRSKIIDDSKIERRDYRPSKWVPNSAMDVWYGNKSMVDIISREFTEIMNRIVDRPARSVMRNFSLGDLKEIRVTRNITSIYNDPIRIWVKDLPAQSTKTSNNIVSTILFNEANVTKVK